MKNIKILGMGCGKCNQTFTIVNQAVSELGLKAEVQKIEDIQEIMKYNVLSTPAVVIDEVVKIKGHVPTLEEITNALS